jgi:hypothetical protein
MGRASWFYVPGDKQVTTGRITDARRGELPFLLLGDPVARERVFIVKQQNRGGNVVTTLQPREKSSVIRSVTVVIAPSTHLIQRIDYTDARATRFPFSFSISSARRVGRYVHVRAARGVQVIRAD